MQRPAFLFLRQKSPVTRRWAWQRASAVVLLFLGPWFMFSAASLFGAPLAHVEQWAGAGLNALFLVAFLAAAALHAAQGLHEIIADYIPNSARRAAAEKWAEGFCVACFAASVLGLILL